MRVNILDFRFDRQDAILLEAYPVDKAGRSYPDWFGPKSMFDRAGFKEVARRKKTRPVVRRRLVRHKPARYFRTDHD